MTVIALNGELKDPIESYQKLLNQNKSSKFVAADGGALLLERLGFKPDIIIGDLDSLTEEKIENFRKKGVKFIEFPVEKDETDGELALDYCRKEGLDQIIIIGAMGGRLDQQLANIFLLEYAYRSGLNTVIREPGLEIGIISDNMVFNNKKDYGLSLIPLSQKVKGVSISGCKYEIEKQTLIRFKTRGISNKIISREAIVSREKGVLIYILDKFHGH